MWERFGLSVMQRLDPEQAHMLTIKALRAGLVPGPGPVTSHRLRTDLAGLRLPNPVGLAAGLDKNAEAVNALGKVGFGFIEAGAVTPLPQAGNAKPRLFRLPEDGAAINRFGFNNHGMDKVAQRLERANPAVPVGLNLGANKDAADRAGDFARVLARCGAFVDFATVNVSSPNTERLRELQGAAALSGLLKDVLAARDELPVPIPVFVKIAPDLGDGELADIAGSAEAAGIDGIIATNTTIDRTGLANARAAETGGLSGKPLFERSTRVLAKLSHLTGGRVPLIGVGGIASVEDAMTKLRAGATAVQLYTALSYHGLSLAHRIATELDAELARAGLASVSDMIGTERDAWL